MSNRRFPLLITLAYTSATLYETSAYGQLPEPPPTQADGAATAANTGGPQKAAGIEKPRPDGLQGEVAALKAENATIREQLRRLEEQQQKLLELMAGLRPDPAVVAGANVPGSITASNQPLPGTSAVPLLATTSPVSSATSAASRTSSMTAAVPPTASATQTVEDLSGYAVPGELHNDRYQDGIVVWQTSDDASVPFLMKFNLNTQVRYLNTTDSEDTYTDHLGTVRDVNTRNDITVNRTMFILGGYIFDKRLRYSSTVWTSAGAASIVVAGTIGWQFDKALTITGGYTGVPGSRSLVNTFPFFTATDRSMADNFFRPGFTQGVWANGDLGNGLNYLVFVGNGLNTLNISANKIDTNLMYSGSVWWEPLGDYGEPGKSRNMYDDYFSSDDVRVRLGTAFTRSREDRFSNLDQSSPENTSMYNSDGVLTFSTGAFAPGVTVQEATYKMWAIDAGMKWNGLAINGQYFFRWIDDFAADGPLPLDSTFDHGFELSASYFVVPRKVVVYGRGSMVNGEFNDSWEYAGGFKWHFLPTERLWLTGEMMYVHKAPYSGAFTPYTTGLTGWVPMVQAIIAF
jgi:hypothetical protein